MSNLPLPSRRPARKHVLAGVFGVVGLGLMLAAVLTASGLGSPFRARGPETVRTGAVVVNEPITTTTGVIVASPIAASQARAVDTVPQAPTTTAPRSTPTTRPAVTTTTTPAPVPIPPTTIPSLLGNLGKSLAGG